VNAFLTQQKVIDRILVFEPKEKAGVNTIKTLIFFLRRLNLHKFLTGALATLKYITLGHNK